MHPYVRFKDETEIFETSDTAMSCVYVCTYNMKDKGAIEIVGVS